MILLNSFYTISEMTTEEGKLHAIIHINPEHNIFEGHFPGQPVVPGVCMLQIVKELMEQLTDQKLIFSKGNQIKFLQLLVPAKEDAIQVNISWKKEDNTYPVTVDFKKNNEAIFKLSGLFKCANQTI
jgi:3-hydroxyacyl-[acyl-carrier-protein] dehydratase